ncbi:MAG TPA: ABC transporter permease [Nocardioidaceae bacterium]|nr:ABC transporter permease [Nocardioidaceae bacterium]
MTPLKIAWLNLRRTMRERTNLFFLVLFPLLLIMVLGLAFGGEFAPRLAVVSSGSGTLAQQLVDELEASSGIDAEQFDSRSAAVTAVEQGRAEGAIVVPEDYDALLAGGDDVVLDYVSSSDRTAQQMGTIVAAVVDQQSARITVARLLQDRVGGDLDGMLALTDGTAAAVPDVSVEASTSGEAIFPEDLGRFDVGASGQLLLFIFVTSMTASTALIETRKLGVSRRMYATPTSVRAIVAGEALGRIAIAVLQGAIIMIGSALLFGVSWGSPAAAALLMLAFAVAAGGAGMLMGALASSTEQAVAIGLLLALGMGALGGSMLPLEFFSPTMYTIAHITPHAWAADGFAELIRRDGSVLDVGRELGVLVGFGAALFAAAAWGLRRNLARG